MLAPAVGNRSHQVNVELSRLGLATRSFPCALPTCELPSGVAYTARRLPPGGRRRTARRTLLAGCDGRFEGSPANVLRQGLRLSLTARCSGRRIGVSLAEFWYERRCGIGRRVILVSGAQESVTLAAGLESASRARRREASPARLRSGDAESIDGIRLTVHQEAKPQCEPVSFVTRVSRSRNLVPLGELEGGLVTTRPIMAVCLSV